MAGFRWMVVGWIRQPEANRCRLRVVGRRHFARYLSLRRICTTVYVPRVPYHFGFRSPKPFVHKIPFESPFRLRYF